MAKVKTPEEFFSDFTSSEKVETPENVDTGLELENEETGAQPEEEEESEQEVELEDQEDADEETEDADHPEEEGSEEEPEEDEEPEDQARTDDEDVDGITFADDEEEEDPDVSKAAEVLGFEGVKTKDQLLEKYQKDLERAKEDALQGIPDNLKEAVQFAKDGGDFMEMLDATAIDYDKVSNRDLVEAQVQKYFLDEDGKLDREALEDWFESEGKAKINMRADQIRNEQKRDQQAKIQMIKDKAQREREKLNSELKSELDKIDQIGGVKLSPSQKESMYRDTVSGQAMEELFYEDGRISNKKLAQNLFKVRMFEKAIQVAKTSAKNDGKREVIAKATNAKVKRPSEKPAAKTKKVDPLDQFFEIVKNRK